MLTSRIWILPIIFFIGFFLKGLILDPDLGWHLATGAYVLNHGIPLTDPFSYSMPSYPYVAYAWLADVLLISFYKVIGIPGLAFFFAAAASGSLLLLLPKKKSYPVIPLLLSGSILLFVMGIRPQVLSWLLFSLLLVLLYRKEMYQYILLPILFVFWANIHSSFPLGLGVVVAYVVCNAIQNKRFFEKDIGLIILCFFATLINPYGIDLWKEIFLIITWTEKHMLLLDWYPGLFVPYLPLWISVFLCLIFIFKHPKIYTLFEKVVFVILVIVGMGAVVDVPYYALFNLPLLIKGFSFHDKKRSFLHNKNFKIAVVLIVILHGLLLFYPKQYPMSAVAYLQKHKLDGNVFTDFNWGGYLLWHLPEKKVFVDGHMPHWKLANPKSDESSNAFQEYLLVADRKKSLESFTQKYQIQTLVLPLGFADRRQLEKQGWKRVYHDATAVIYQR